MRFYVLCKYHNNEKIYLKFDKEPQVRSDIPPYFNVTCPNGIADNHQNSEVKAEMGLEPIGGAILGGILFIVDPLLGIAGAGLGLFGMIKKETDKVEKFNKS